MQYRYRLAGSNQRKSTTQQSSNANTHKNDTLVYINLLDKCTQILREDRIWIRNQLKSGDQQLFKIFKEAKRPLNLQHLQIRLRKHVTAVKSKAKMEQLLKFKENMHLGDWQHKEDNYVEKAQQNKGSSKYQLSEGVKTYNAQHKGLRGKSNSSLEKPKMSMHQHRGTSVNTKKNPESYQVPMEQITQRESENMTSARHRAFSDDNESYAFSNVYNQWKRPEQNSLQHNGYMNDSFRNKFNQTSNFNNHFTNEFGKQKSKLSPFAEINAQPVYKRKQKIEQPLEMHFGEASCEHSNDHGDYSYTHKNQINYLEDYSPNQVKQQTQPQHSHSHSRSNHSHSSFLENLNQSGRKCEQNSKTIEEIQRESLSAKKYEIESYKSDSFDETNLMQSKNNTIPLSNDTNNQSLFTSPELLAECRNFLKLKSSAKPSVQKQYVNNKYSMQFNSNFEPLKFDFKQPFNSNQKDASDYQNSITKVFHDIKTDMTSSISQPHEFQFDHKPNYSAEISKITREVTNKNSSLPRQQPTRPSLQREQDPRQSLTRGSFTKQLLSKEATKEHPTKQTHNLVEPSSSGNNGSYEYFHTFSGLSTHKKVQPSLASPEEFLDLVFEAVSSEHQGYILWSRLENLVDKKCPKYLDSFRQYLCPSEGDQLVLISNIGRLLQDLMSEQNIQPADNDSRTICRLLDIEQKGYINEQDIEDFIRQLEDSEAEDIQVISQYLWRLFESIDKDAEETEEKRIDYWGVYSKKNSSDFEELNEILKQFQFQIE